MESNMLPHIKFSDSWLNFVDAVRTLWEHELKDTKRPNLKNYEKLIEQVITAIKEAGFVFAIQESWFKLNEEKRSRVAAEIYLSELQSFKEGVKALKPPPQNEESDTKERKRYLLGDGKTIFGSTKDLFDNLPGWTKSILTVAGEVADLFKRKTKD